MDFTTSELSEMVQGLTNEILERHLDDAGLRHTEESPDGLHDASWAALADAGLIGLGIPEAQGGFGGGLEELHTFLRCCGYHTAPTTALTTAGMVAPFLARLEFSGREELLEGVLSGTTLLGLGSSEPHSRDPRMPDTQARKESGSWRLTGEKTHVLGGMRADHVLTTATTNEGVGVFLVERSASGIRFERQKVSTGEALAHMTLEDAPALHLGPVELLDHALPRFSLAVAAVMLGTAERALKLTTAYVGQREQFGQRIGTFQAVAHRAADAWIDLQAMELTLLKATWRLDAGLPAERETHIARYWANRGGHRIVAAAQHLHGGMGYDRDYPLYRTFLLVKRLESLLGGRASELQALGDVLARP